MNLTQRRRRSAAFSFRLQKCPTSYDGLLVSGTGRVWRLLQPKNCAPLVAAWPRCDLLTFVLLIIGLTWPVDLLAQGVPPAAVDQFQQVVGNRVEAVTILGGDYGAAGGLYTFRGGRVANVSVSKIGGGGDVAQQRSLGIGDLTWAPVLLGNLGYISANNQFDSGVLQGNPLKL